MGIDDEKKADLSSKDQVAPAVMQVTQQQLVLRKNIQKLVGNPGSGISLEDWIRAVETYCSAHGITKDADIIKEARDQVSFEAGPARKAIRRTNFETWVEFKNHLRIWLQVKPPEVHLDLYAFYSARWKKEDKFIDYVDNLRDLLERLKTLELNTADEMKGYYRYMEAAIIAQVPDEIRKDYMEKQFKVTNEKEFETFVNQIQISIARYGAKPSTKPILAIEGKSKSNKGMGSTNPQSTDRFRRSAEQGRHPNMVSRVQTQKTGEYTGSAAGQQKPTTWEQKHHLCGRCLKPNHIRVNCYSKTVKCSICWSVEHEFRDCQRNRRFNNVSRGQQKGKEEF